MRKSQKNNSKLSRFVHYKYSGPIVFVPIILISVLGYYNMTVTAEFFDPWSCDTLRDYVLGDEVPDRFPLHNEITEEQHLRLHIILQECQDLERFSAPMSHSVNP